MVDFAIILVLTVVGFLRRLWQSVTGRTYSIRVSTNLIMDRFTNSVIGGLLAYPPENVYTDTVDRLGGVFYRIWLDQ